METDEAEVEHPTTGTVKRPNTGQVEARTAAVEVEDRRIRGLVPYGVESRDLGGWTEIIDSGAFRNTDLSELRAVIDHAGVPLGRYPATLDVEDRDDGLHWSLDPPRSREDVIEAIERGDMRAGSWRMVVSRDRWEGDVRHVEAISELKDVTIVGAHDPAYGDAARVEYRTKTTGGHRQEGANMDPENTGGTNTVEIENTENTEERTSSEETTENRTEQGNAGAGAGVLQVEQGTVAPRTLTLAEAFRSAGFPGETATISYEKFEDRAITWNPSVNLQNQADRQAGPRPVDGRYAWTALERVPVDEAVTSVQVLVHLSTQAATGVVRDIAATTAKAEVGSTIDLQTVPLKGVAAVESNIPNVTLAQPAIESVINVDLLAAVNDGLDSLVVATFAASGFQAPGSDNPLVSYRKAMTTLFAAGYNPDTLILTPSASEAIDTMVSGLSGGTADFVFTAGAFGPDRIFNMRRIVSKSIPAPVVLDSGAYGKLFASPAQLTVHEQDGGLTNLSRVRLELHAAAGVERQAAAIRVAAS